jgi:putative hemolysin
MDASRPLATVAAQVQRPSAYSVLVASTDAEIRAAQRLRHLVFAQELGARLHSSEPGLDADDFDRFCDHLVVRDDTTGAIVGTYRLLLPARAPHRLYAETEFDLTALEPLRGVLVEAGRSCVHPDHRGGAVINLMWTGIARYLHLHGHRWLAGCASVPIADGGAAAALVWELARAKHLSPPRLRVTPHRPYLVGPGARASGASVDRHGAPSQGRPAVPPLLRGYLRLGAWICGEPAHDPDFDVADFFVLLSLDRVNPRYLDHFLGAGERP